ncbi:hypothetical protein STRMOE7_24270 [Streptomyces sp. MOE7]|nr:hypothetical protein STRMOE7_24270 [Streptomyces sp. MOE7]
MSAPLIPYTASARSKAAAKSPCHILMSARQNPAESRTGPVCSSHTCWKMRAAAPLSPAIRRALAAARESLADTALPARPATSGARSITARALPRDSRDSASRQSAASRTELSAPGRAARYSRRSFTIPSTTCRPPIAIPRSAYSWMCSALIASACRPWWTASRSGDERETPPLSGLRSRRSATSSQYARSRSWTDRFTAGDRWDCRAATISWCSRYQPWESG